MKVQPKSRGILFGVISAVLLGLSPAIGRYAIHQTGTSPFFVVAFRSLLATFLLFMIIIIFYRKYLYIYPLGLVGCFFAGLLNGIGSILYYAALARLDASLGQLLYSVYPIFVAFWLLLDRHPINKFTFIRLALTLPGIYLLLAAGRQDHIDWVGAGMMIGAAMLYALHLIVNQRILYEAPAPTVTLYTLISMTLVVITAWLIFDRTFPVYTQDWIPVAAMGAILFLSRITLFIGIKHLGGIQTAILGLGELLTTVVIAHLWLHEQMTWQQWIGALFLLSSLFLVGLDKGSTKKGPMHGIFAWLNPPSVKPGEINWDN